MQQSITIARPAHEVFSHLADIDHWSIWLPQLRREECSRPDSGLDADAANKTVAWSFEPSGQWSVVEKGDVSELTLRIKAEQAKPNDPTEDETPQEAMAHGITAALQSIKSHLEGVYGGDPDVRTGDAAQKVYGQSAENDVDRFSTRR